MVVNSVSLHRCAMWVSKVFELVLGGQSLTSPKRNLIAHVDMSGIVIDKDGSAGAAVGLGFFAMRVRKATGHARHELISRDTVTRSHVVPTNGHFGFRLVRDSLRSRTSLVLLGVDTG